MAVVREDVVQIGFEVENNPFAELTAETNQFVNSVTGGVNEAVGDLQNLSGMASGAGDGLHQMASAAQELNGANANGLANSINNTEDAAQNTTRTFTQMLGSLRDIARTRIDIGVTRLRDGLARIRNLPNQLSTGFNTLRTRVQQVGSMNMHQLANALNVGIGRALTSAANGARTLATRLRDAASVGLSRLTDGMRSLATHAANAATALGKGLVKGAKVAVAGVGAAAVAVGGLVAKSVSAFADYEQLVGGVETLFGAGGMEIKEYAKSVGKSVADVQSEYNNLMSAQDTVLKNANDAYKTAGLSSNKYMDTVTSFSASLISSVGGDTQKAADLADVAIRDMSDNANKMGTDMDSIIETYKSLAKGNYGMLDNLKIGYGGTKSEMERLVKDAAKLDSSVDANSMSYGNLVKAIHAVQENMGITGTTQKEAEKTISGSLSAMKAAWGNMLTAMAQGGDSFDQCITNLVSSVKTFAGNILPVIKSALSGAIQLIAELAPMIAQEVPALITTLLPELVSAANIIVRELLNATQSEVGNLANMGVEIITSIINCIVSNLPKLVEVAGETVAALVQGVAQQLPTLIDTVVYGIICLQRNIVELLPTLIDAGIQLILGLAQGIIDTVPLLISYVPENFQKIINVITQSLPKIINAGIQLIQMLITGIIQNLPALVQSALQMINALVEGLVTNLPVIIQAALSLIQALVEGLVQNLPMLIQAAISLVNGLCTGLLQQLPLLVTMAIQLVLSLVQGLIGQLPLLVQAAIQLVVGLVTGLLQNLPLVIEAAKGLIGALGGGLVEAIPELLKAMPQIVTAIIEGLMTVDWLKVGKDIIGGVWDGIQSLFGAGDNSGKEAANSVAKGINDNSYTAETAGTNLATNTTNSMMLNNTQINSFGVTGATTLANGITANTGMVTTAASNLASSTTNSLRLNDAAINDGGVISMQSLASGITTNAGMVTSAANEVVASTSNSFNALQNTAQLGAETVTNLASSISANTGTATNAALNMSTQVSDAANTEVEVQIKAETASMDDFVSKVTDMVKASDTSLKELPDIFESSINDSATAMTTGMEKMIQTFENELNKCLSITKETMSLIKTTVAMTDLYSSGVNVMQGFISGMNNMRPQVIAVAKSIAKAASSTINKALDIHSPSRVTTESGEYTAIGLANGMQNMKNAVTASAKDISVSASETIKPELSSYAPSNSTTNTSNSTNNYSPQFVLNLNGASATETNKRKVMQWFRECFDEYFESMGRIEPEICEV
uniref:hypothetical protein n=1 Tax=Acetatifactor sp. TaxID=1872090 RepID=UPI0040559F23